MCIDSDRGRIAQIHPNLLKSATLGPHQKTWNNACIDHLAFPKLS